MGLLEHDDPADEGDPEGGAPVGGEGEEMEDPCGGYGDGWRFRPRAEYIRRKDKAQCKERHPHQEARRPRHLNAAIEPGSRVLWTIWRIG